MKYRVYILLFLFLPLTLTKADSDLIKEQQIKAAFVYNFIKFIEWPKEKMQDNNEPIIIGIIGSSDFVKSFDPVKNKQVKNKNIIIKYFDGFKKIKEPKESDNSLLNNQIDALKKCHILFFCTCNSEEIQNPDQIIKNLEGSYILTVGEIAGFLEDGGMIRLFVDNAKVRFDVNLKASDKSKLTISSSLLRLAEKTVVDSKSSNDKNK